MSIIKVKIDKVKNPWQTRLGVVVFDIETELLDDWSEEGKKNAVFKCGVAYNYSDNKYYKLKDPKKLVKLLNSANAVVSYNGEGFDFYVLQKHGLKTKKYNNRLQLDGIESLDIMHTIHLERPKKNQNKKYLKLEEMMLENYGVKKNAYDETDINQLMQHCFDDVKYTKMLYEENIWKVPIIVRKKTERVWENDYDDDFSGIVFDGINETRVVDFGMPIENTIINPDDTLLCPLCRAARLSLYEISRKKTNETKCSKCGAVVTFSLSNEIISIESKKEFESNVCPNCKKRIRYEEHSEYGHGAGSGTVSSGTSICPICKEGCYEWSNDDIPGFRDSWKGSCCKCGERIE